MPVPAFAGPLRTMQQITYTAQIFNSASFVQKSLRIAQCGTYTAQTCHSAFLAQNHMRTTQRGMFTAQMCKRGLSKGLPAPVSFTANACIRIWEGRGGGVVRCRLGVEGALQGYS